MEKNQVAKGDFFEWWDNEGRSHWIRRYEKLVKKDRKTPEEMIRALQGIFCKGRYRPGRYRSWAGG